MRVDHIYIKEIIMDYSDKANVERLRLAFLEVMDYFSGKPHEVVAHCGCTEERAKEILAIAAQNNMPVGE